MKSLDRHIALLQHDSWEVHKKLQEKNEEIERLKEMKLHTEKYASEMEDKYILEKNKNERAIEYIEYYFAKGRTKNNKQFDLSLYEILTGKNLFSFTRKERDQFFKELIKSE